MTVSYGGGVMHEDNEFSTAVLIGEDVELWSLSRTKRGFSCVRTIYADCANQAYSALEAAGMRDEDPGADGVIIDSLPISQPTASTGGSVVRPADAVAFFVDGRDQDANLLERAQALVTTIAPLLSVVE
jgi:hypothetical protein